MNESVWQHVMDQFQSPEVLYYESNHRRQRFYAPLDSLPETVYIPLYEPLPVSLEELPQFPEYLPKKRVAIYRRLPRRGEYCKDDWYEYRGDSDI